MDIKIYNSLMKLTPTGSKVNNDMRAIISNHVIEVAQNIDKSPLIYADLRKAVAFSVSSSGIRAAMDDAVTLGLALNTIWQPSWDSKKNPAWNIKKPKEDI